MPNHFSLHINDGYRSKRKTTVFVLAVILNFKMTAMWFVIYFRSVNYRNQHIDIHRSLVLRLYYV